MRSLFTYDEMETIGKKAGVKFAQNNGEIPRNISPICSKLNVA
jgi:hypothetical protein